MNLTERLKRNRKSDKDIKRTKTPGGRVLRKAYRVARRDGKWTVITGGNMTIFDAQKVAHRLNERDKKR